MQAYRKMKRKIKETNPDLAKRLARAKNGALRKTPYFGTPSRSAKEIAARLKADEGASYGFEAFSDELGFLADQIGKRRPRLGEWTLGMQRETCRRLIQLLNRSEDAMAVYQPEPHDSKEMWKQLQGILDFIGDSVILEAKTSAFMKLFLLSQKSDFSIEIATSLDGANDELLPLNTSSGIAEHDAFVVVNENVVCRASYFRLKIDRVHASDRELSIEGFYRIPACLEGFRVIPYVLVNGQKREVPIVPRYTSRHVLDKPYSLDLGFRFEHELDGGQAIIEFVLEVEGASALQKELSYSNYCPIANEISNSRLLRGRYSVAAETSRIVVSERRDQRPLYSELVIRENVLHSKTPDLGTQRLLFLRDFAFLAQYGFDEAIYGDLVIRKSALWEFGEDLTDVDSILERYVGKDALSGRRVWLLIDRPDRADDNAEAFFRYLGATEHPGIDCYFLLKRSSDGISGLEECGPVIEPLSLAHQMLHAIADYVISSQLAEFVINPFNENLAFLRDLRFGPRFVFLQHGVTHNHNGPLLGAYGRDFRGIVTTGLPEYEYLASPFFGYEPSNIWQVGFPRFDRLYRNNKKCITIMPTWRKWLTERRFDPEIGSLAWVVKDDFAESEYFQFYQRLITDKRLLFAAAKHGYRINMLLHVTFLKQAELFQHDETVTVYGYEKSYREVYAESSLILTDYSSAVFDFAFLRRPVLYCQFDRDDFWANHTVKRGYFDFDKDGFGEVAQDLDTCVNLLIEYIESDCALKDEYRERIDGFFAFENDSKCCERLFNRILEDQEQE